MHYIKRARFKDERRKRNIVWDETCKKQKFTPELLEELKDYMDCKIINVYTR